MATNHSPLSDVVRPAAARRLHLRVARRAGRGHGRPRQRDRRRPVVHPAAPRHRRATSAPSPNSSATISSPSRKAYVEYSNEVWNWIFGQAHWAQSPKPAKRWGADGRRRRLDAVRRHARRADRRDLGRRLRHRGRGLASSTVVATQTGWLGAGAAAARGAALGRRGPGEQSPPGGYLRRLRGHRLLRQPARRREGARCARAGSPRSREAAEHAAVPRALAGPSLAAEVEQHRFDLATVRAAAELRDGSVTGQPDDSIAAPRRRSLCRPGRRSPRDMASTS